MALSGMKGVALSGMKGMALSGMPKSHRVCPKAIGIDNVQRVDNAQRVTPLPAAGHDNDNFAFGFVLAEPGGDLFKGAAAVLFEFL